MFNKFDKLKIWRWMKNTVEFTRSNDWSDVNRRSGGTRLTGLGFGAGRSRSQHPAPSRAGGKVLHVPVVPRQMTDKTFITVRAATLPGLLRSTEITSLALTGPGHADPLGQKPQATADLGRAAPAQGCVSQRQSCAGGNGLPAKAGHIPWASATACPPAGWAPTLDTKLLAWHPCKQRVN